MLIYASLLLLAASQEGVGPIDINDTAIDISGSDHRITLDCKMREVTIAGSGHVVVLKGTCASIDVSGANNQVTVHLRPGALLSVSGSENQLRWQSGGEVRRQVSGVGHSIVRMK